MSNIYANPVGITKDIYKITNNINGKIYIGQAKNTKERFRKHCQVSNCESIIDIAINKYGKENFSCEIIESQIINYNEREKYWIKKLNSKVPIGYNVSDGGEEPPVFYGINHPNASIKSQEILDKIIIELADTLDSYSVIAKNNGTNKKTILGINNGTRYFNPNLTYPIRKNPNINGILTEKVIDEIIEELRYSYDTNTNIGTKYGVSEKTIRLINSGQEHHRDTELYPIRSPYAARAKMSYDEIMEIANLLKNSNISINQIAKQYKVNWNTINNINNGSSVFFRRELTYPLRLPPHKK